MPITAVLDCDPGHDDAIALLLALASPELELLGVTTTYGNQTLAKTTANASESSSSPGAATFRSRPVPTGRSSASSSWLRTCTERAASTARPSRTRPRSRCRTTR